MKLKVKKLNFEAGNVKVVVLNYQDASKLGQKAGDRLFLKKIETDDMKPFIVLLDIAHSDTIVAPGEIGIFLDIIKKIGIENDEVSVVPAEPPQSYKFIQKKVHGQKLSTEEINQIITDSVSGRLSPIELATLITGVSINGMDNEEMTALTFAEARSGTIFNFGSDVYDKHSTYMAFSAI